MFQNRKKNPFLFKLDLKKETYWLLLTNHKNAKDVKDVCEFQ